MFMMNCKYLFSIHTKFKQAVILLILLSFAFLFLNLIVGSVSLSLQSFNNSETHFILMMRFSRGIVAFLCGGLMAIGSAILQSLTRNEMIAPDLTGMTSIGCLLIIICETFWIKSDLVNEILGILGAGIGFSLCFALLGFKKTNHRLAMILVGMTISFSATACIQLMLLKVPQNIDSALRFMSGSLYAMSSNTVIIVFLSTLFILPWIFIISKRFIMLSIDDATAHTLGVSIKKFRMFSFLVAALLIGTSLIGLGNIGFLGIVAPNIARLIIGNRSPYLFILSFLVGGFIYLVSDMLGRIIISPAEIPAGMMMNMLTAPFFLVVLWRYFRGVHEWH